MISLELTVNIYMTKFADIEKRRLTVTDILLWSLLEQNQTLRNRAKKWQFFFGVENCFGVILILVELRYFRNSKNKKEENIAKSDLWIKHEIIGFRLCRLRVKLVYFWVRNFSNFYERIADVRFWNQSRGQKRSLQLASLRQSWFFLLSEWNFMIEDDN